MRQTLWGEFQQKGFILKKYSDDRITDVNGLWDNLYGYDKAIKAVKDTKTELIQDITPEMSNIKLGNIGIKLFNYENEYEADGSLEKNVAMKMLIL